MNISSVGSQELYKILFGREVSSRVDLIEKDSGEPIKPNHGDVFGRTNVALSDPYKIDPDASSIISLFETGDGVGTRAPYFSNRFFKNDNEFASFFADIGKRLDVAYAEGKFTEDEYNELNKNLDDYITYMKDKSDEQRAKYELIRSNYFKDHVNVMTGDEEKDKQTMDDFRAMQKNAIDKILNRKGFVTNISVIMDMINNLRYGNNSPNLVNSMLLK